MTPEELDHGDFLRGAYMESVLHLDISIGQVARGLIEMRTMSAALAEHIGTPDFDQIFGREAMTRRVLAKVQELLAQSLDRGEAVPTRILLVAEQELLDRAMVSGVYGSRANAEAAERRLHMIGVSAAHVEEAPGGGFRIVVDHEHTGLV
jgi:hypothetical protein